MVLAILKTFFSNLYLFLYHIYTKPLFSIQRLTYPHQCTKAVKHFNSLDKIGVLLKSYCQVFIST